MRRTWLLLGLLAFSNALLAQPYSLMDLPWTSGGDQTHAQESGPVVTDLTGDGQDEIILTGRQHIYVTNSSGGMCLHMPRIETFD